MAVRSPTSYNAYADIAEVMAGKIIYASILNDVFNDQFFCAKKNELLISDCFYPLTHNGTDWYVHGKYAIHQDWENVFKSATTCDVKFAICAWASAAIDFDVALNFVGSGVGRVAINVVANQDQAIWRGWQTSAASVLIDSTEDEILVESRRVGGSASNYIYVGGVGLFTDE